ncbi:MULTISPECIES: hypothetical protein [Bordetella]|jgi:hypothetical protein|uniref:hypothetical protein n=1 Tax=Bordetella TaxID=517 RepID=UPI00114066C7|nr:hypothetical protein [Bordetella genomosp. 4]
MEVSTSRATPPGKPAGGAPGGWRGFRDGVTHFLEAIGEILHGMDEARQAHPIISSCRVIRR